MTTDQLAAQYDQVADACERASHRAVDAGAWLLADQFRRWAAQNRVKARAIREGPTWQELRAARNLAVE